jgi:hypothetical protein
MLKSILDEALTFLLAFAMIMPWTAISTANTTFSGVSALAKESGVVHVAIASDFTHPLPAKEQNGTVMALIESVRELMGDS